MVANKELAAVCRVSDIASTGFAHKRPIFDKVLDCVLCCVECSVKQYSLKTGQLIHSFACGSEVAGCCINPKTSVQLITCGADGVWLTWDLVEGVLLQRQRLPAVVKSVVFLYWRADNYFLACCDHDDVCNLYVFAELDAAFSGDKLKIVVPPDENKLAISPRAEYVAYVLGDVLHVRSLHRKGRKICHYSGGQREFTCIAQHPTEFCLATGDVTGRILIWHNFLANSKPDKSIYHWHTMPVADLVFSSEGHYLYSGGTECVLVKWALEARGKQAQEFIARLDAPVARLGLSYDSSFIAICLKDSGVAIASTGQMKIVHSVQGFIRRPELSRLLLSHGCGTPLACEVLLGGGSQNEFCLIANGRPGQLQFYNPSTETLVMNLDVVGQNLPPAERGCDQVFTEVTQIAVTREYLATVEARLDPVICDEMTLKIWRNSSNLNRNSFDLIACIEWPHSSAVTSLLFASLDVTHHSLSLVSGSLDGKFKVWTCDEGITKTEALHWSCDRVGYYRSWPVRSLDFSGTQDLLAVAFNHVLTLWSFSMHRLLRAQEISSEDEPIRTVLFAGHHQPDILVVSTMMQLCALSVTSSTVLWCLDVFVNCVCRDISSGVFAVFEKAGQVSFFYPDKPLLILPSVGISAEKEIGSRTYSACFVPDNVPVDASVRSQPSDLYFIEQQQKLVCLSWKTTTSIDSAVNSQRKRPSNEETPLSKVLAQKKIAYTRNPAQPAPTQLSDRAARSQLLAGPAHASVSVTDLAPAYISLCLPKRDSVADQKLEATAGLQDVKRTHTVEYVAPVLENARNEGDRPFRELTFEWLLDTKAFDSGV